MPDKKPYSLLNNSRFYVLLSTFLLSLMILAWLKLKIPSDQLFYIRTQQLYGLLCIVYWYVALAISPVGHIIGKNRMRHIEFTRRAIGVSAFYFAMLHASVALWGQLGGLGQIQHLPSLFKLSLLGGSFALLILLIMAATSFDKVVNFMTFRYWKWLHRLVYLGGVLAVLHIWSIGTHLAYTKVQVAAFFALIALAGLELFRVTKIVNQKLKLVKSEAVVLYLSAWAIVILLLLMIPSVIKNYHDRHRGHDVSAVQNQERA